LILYPGESRPASEICVLDVVRTEPGAGHATIDIQEIVRIEADPQVSYSARPRSGWTPPPHFKGPAPTQRSGPGKDPYRIPVRFELEPGRYRVAFLYVPVSDRFGWTHRNSTESSVRVECPGGSVYSMEGRFLGGQAGWILSITERPSGG
jgi:hypothetical protein